MADRTRDAIFWNRELMAAVQEPWRPRTRADRKILNVRVVDLSILHNIAESRLTGRPPWAVSAIRVRMPGRFMHAVRIGT